MHAATHAEDGQVGQAADEDCLPCMAALAEVIVIEEGCSLLLRQSHCLNPCVVATLPAPAAGPNKLCCPGSCKCAALMPSLQPAWLGQTHGSLPK